MWLFGMLVVAGVSTGCSRENPAFDELQNETDGKQTTDGETTKGVGTDSPVTSAGGGSATTSDDPTGDGSAGSTGPAPSSCGNGVVDANEECDPKANVPDVVCNPRCELNTCGDGYPLGGEACDDGNAVDDDDCTNACRLPDCGDGIINGDEACEKMIEDAVSCSRFGFESGTALCTACHWDKEGCFTCGDGITQAAESCDPQDFVPVQCANEANLEGQGSLYCTNTCAIESDGGECCAPDGAPCPFDVSDACCTAGATCVGGVCQAP